jgi:hypothetical protein
MKGDFAEERAARGIFMLHCDWQCPLEKSIPEMIAFG